MPLDRVSYLLFTFFQTEAAVDTEDSGEELNLFLETSTDEITSPVGCPPTPGTPGGRIWPSTPTTDKTIHAKEQTVTPNVNTCISMSPPSQKKENNSVNVSSNVDKKLTEVKGAGDSTVASPMTFKSANGQRRIQLTTLQLNTKK